MNDFNNDVFFEQIVGIKKTGINYLAFAGIWLLALIIIAALLLFPILGAINLLVIFGVGYGAYKLSSLLNIEYEYIITNGTFDVDKIINRSSRKRIHSFELEAVSEIGKFNPKAALNKDKKTVTIACNPNDENAYYLIAPNRGTGQIYLVFSPDDKMKTAILKFIPKHISFGLFK